MGLNMFKMQNRFECIFLFPLTVCPTISGQELMLAVSWSTARVEELLNNTRGEGLLGDGDRSRLGESLKLSKSPEEHTVSILPFVLTVK